MRHSAGQFEAPDLAANRNLLDWDLFQSDKLHLPSEHGDSRGRLPHCRGPPLGYQVVDKFSERDKRFRRDWQPRLCPMLPWMKSIFLGHCGRMLLLKSHFQIGNSLISSQSLSTLFQFLVIAEMTEDIYQQDSCYKKQRFSLQQMGLSPLTRCLRDDLTPQRLHQILALFFQQ